MCLDNLCGLGEAAEAFILRGWWKPLGLSCSYLIWIWVVKHKSDSWSQAWWFPLLSFQCPALDPCYHCRAVMVTAVSKLHLHRLKSWPRCHDLRPQPNPLLSNRLPSNPHSPPIHNNPPYLLLTRMDRTDTAAINTLRARLPSTVSSDMRYIHVSMDTVQLPNSA